VSDHPTDFQGDIPSAVRTAVTSKLPDAVVEVTGGNGHWTLVVTSAGFADKSTLARHRLVMSAIAPLMDGAAPPIHAVDSLVTKLP
jgi:acid stress-induced BolA-like protein IbaG/YrbA